MYAGFPCYPTKFSHDFFAVEEHSESDLNRWTAHLMIQKSEIWTRITHNIPRFTHQSLAHHYQLHQLHLRCGSVKSQISTKSSKFGSNWSQCLGEKKIPFGKRSGDPFNPWPRAWRRNPWWVRWISIWGPGPWKTHKISTESLDRFLICFFFRKNGEVFPNNFHGVVFPTKNEQHLGWEIGGVYHHLRKHPNNVPGNWLDDMIHWNGRKLAWEREATLEGEAFELVFLFGLEVMYWLVVSTRVKNIGQIGNLPQVGVKIKTIEKYLKTTT